MKTPEEIISLIGNNYDTMEPIGDDGKPCGDLGRVRYSLTVHDLQSALSAAPSPEVEPCVAPYKSHQCRDCGLVIQQVLSPSAELVKAAEEVLEILLRKWVDSDNVVLNMEEKGRVNVLRIELNKTK